MKKVKAYKVFNHDWTCRGFKYKVGETYETDKPIKLCESGFHACKIPADCFNYYSFNPENKVAEVELLGDILGIDEDKQCTNKIRIVREISWEEMLTLCNTGNGNSGNRNSGNRNSGDYNSGYYNSGDYNSGNRNSGNRNSGNRNSGDYNSGYYNSGDCNSGDYNSGDCNSGDYNSGDYNSGDCNSGDYNSGNRNSGYYNSGNRNSGAFNVDEPKMRIFGKESQHTQSEFFNKFGFWRGNFVLTEYKDDKLINYTYKEAWANMWKSLPRVDKDWYLNLPNFDAEIFKEITGIEVSND